MAKGNFLDGTPVWNTLKRNQRIHARSGLATLRECLTHYASFQSKVFTAKEIVFDLPDDAVRDARLTLANGQIVFSVTHGKHKLFDIEITDSRGVPAPETVDDVRSLADAWEECIKTSTNLVSEQEFLKQNRLSVHPAVCAASRYDATWQEITVRVGKMRKEVWVDIKTNATEIRRFNAHGSKLDGDCGVLSQSLLKALSADRPYVALYGANARRQSASIRIGNRHGISIKNDLGTIEMLRVINEAHERDWCLQAS